MNTYCNENLGFHETQKKYALTIVQSQCEYSRSSVLLFSSIQKNYYFYPQLSLHVWIDYSQAKLCQSLLYQKGHVRQTSKVGSGFRKNLDLNLYICAYVSVKEYFVNLQLFGIVWTVEVLSLMFHFVCTLQETARVCLFSLFFFTTLYAVCTVLNTGS